jgi:hypothetical protein
MNVSKDMPAAASTTEPFTPAMERWIRDHVPEESDLRKRIRFERGFGPVTDSILGFASKAEVDMIVMSISQLDPVMAAHLPHAGTAHELVSRASCPVLTVRV